MPDRTMSRTPAAGGLAVNPEAKGRAKLRIFWTAEAVAARFMASTALWLGQQSKGAENP
jgi:hypothetical protein